MDGRAAIPIPHRQAVPFPDGGSALLVSPQTAARRIPIPPGYTAPACPHPAGEAPLPAGQQLADRVPPPGEPAARPAFSQKGPPEGFERPNWGVRWTRPGATGRLPIPSLRRSSQPSSSSTPVIARRSVSSRIDSSSMNMSSSPSRTAGML